MLLSNPSHGKNGKIAGQHEHNNSKRRKEKLLGTGGRRRFDLRLSAGKKVKEKGAEKYRREEVLYFICFGNLNEERDI